MGLVTHKCDFEVYLRYLMLHPGCGAEAPWVARPDLGHCGSLLK